MAEQGTFYRWPKALRYSLDRAAKEKDASPLAVLDKWVGELCGGEYLRGDGESFSCVLAAGHSGLHEAEAP